MGTGACETLAFSRLTLETSDEARQLIANAGLMPVHQNGHGPVVGFAMTMPVARNLIGDCVETGKHNVAITPFNRNSASYIGMDMPSWKTVTINERPEFVFCNTAYMERYWVYVQAILGAYHCARISNSLGLKLWDSIRLASGGYRLLKKQFAKPYVSINRASLSGHISVRQIIKELEAYGKVVAVTNHKDTIQAWAAPLSLLPVIEKCGYSSQSLEFRMLRRNGSFSFRNGVAYRMRMQVNRHEITCGDKYVLLPPNLLPELRAYVEESYAVQNPFPVLDDMFVHSDHIPVPNFYSSRLTCGMAELFNTMQGAQAVKSFIAEKTFRTKRAISPRRQVLFTAIAGSLAQRLGGIEFSEPDFFRPFFSRSDKSLDWIARNRHIMFGLVDEMEDRRFSVTRSVFDELSSGGRCNIMFTAGDKPDFALTISERIAKAALLLAQLQRSGIQQVPKP